VIVRHRPAFLISAKYAVAFLFMCALGALAGQDSPGQIQLTERMVDVGEHSA
jgi:hypothetical protein